MSTWLARGARIVLSGGVSQYNAQQMRGPSDYLELIFARASMTGMLFAGENTGKLVLTRQ